MLPFATSKVHIVYSTVQGIFRIAGAFPRFLQKSARVIVTVTDTPCHLHVMEHTADVLTTTGSVTVGMVKKHRRTA